MYVQGADKKNPINIDKSSSSGSKKLQRATLIHNVSSGQVHQKKVTNLNKVNEILKPALSNFMAAQKAGSENVKTLTDQCMEVVNSKSPSDTPQVKLQKQLAIGEKMVAAREDAIVSYDDAISRIKNISHAVTLRGKAAKGGVMDAFVNLGLSEPKTMELVGKLREIRAKAYDDLQYTQAWHAYIGAIQEQMAANAAADKIELVQWAMDADLSNLSTEEHKVVKEVLPNAELTLNEQLKIHTEKSEAAMLKYASCVDLLAPLPVDGVTLPDSGSAKEALKQSLDFELSLHVHGFNYQVEPGFRAQQEKVGQAFASALTNSSTMKTKDDELQVLVELADLGLEAKSVGMEALAYADRTIDLCDKCLSQDLDFKREEKDGFLTQKKQLQADKAKLVMDVFDMQRMELLLLVQMTVDQYDPGLMESYDQAQHLLSKAKTIHHDCANTMAGDADEGVPEYLLHEVLKTLPAAYEDAARQMRYLAGQFQKKGKGVVNNDRVVEQLKLLADRSQAMAELAESQLGQVESAGNTDQGTAIEAQLWIDSTLRLKFPSIYQTEDPVDDLTEELAELEVAKKPGYASGSSTGANAQKKAAPAKGPTPPQKNPAKELKKAITSAENALKSEQTQEDLARLAKDSDKHSRNARQGAQEGASPCTVEDTMKLAAQAESDLADRKTKIAKKFQTALDKMTQSHPKYKAFKNQISTLTVEAGKHKEKHDALLKEGEDLRIRVSKNLPPTHSLFNYLYDKGEVQSVKRGNRLERDSKDADGNFRINPRTNEVIKDYIDSYEITFKGSKKIVAHFHYKSMDANDMDIVACHFKTWEQRNQGLQYVMKEAKEGRDVELHRGRTNRETLVKLQKMTGNKTS